MASDQDVRRYLAYWFQLGKKVYLYDGQESCLPQPVIQGDRYSKDFEACWQRILSSDTDEAYLEGTHQSIKELLSSSWSVTPCARCSMPVPVKSLGEQSLACPCDDLPTWPNTELPTPRSPVNHKNHLGNIQERLKSLV